ncbi:MAG: hypothetical protein MR016_02645 [Agathobacter sp.]|nr:hypothetical protein [Agathobacter sp.]
MMEKLKYKMVQFMQGRNGMDQLAKAESGLIFALLILSVILSILPFKSAGMALFLLLLEIVWIALFVHMYFRMFSKNLGKRYAENQKYCTWRYQMTVKWSRMKNEWAQRKTHRFFRCPQCRQKVRVPKGRGKICITCPRCRTEFTRHS